jgi:hypothetical protein
MDSIINIGHVFDDVIGIIGVDYDLHANNSNTALIANISAKILDMKRFGILAVYNGQAWLIPAESYDLIAFGGLRAMFGFEFPRIAIVTYRDENYIFVKRFGDRELEEKDYWPHTTENCHFRFNLALIVYFCRLVGCPLHLKDVRVLNGIPFIWKGKNLGYRNTTTVNEKEFEKIFGISLKALKTGEGNYMAHAVIEYFRGIDFDTDILRGILYIKDTEIRYRKGMRVKHPLVRKPKVIEELIEENYSLLMGEYPFNIFNSHLGRPKQNYINQIALGKIK